MSQGTSGSGPRSFGPTRGLVTGWIAGAIGVLGALLLVMLADAEWGLAAGLLALGLATWCFLARPRVLLDRDEVELRNAFTSWRVPLAAIDDVQVRHSTVVTVDGQSYVGDAVTRSVGELFGRESGQGVPDRMIAAIRGAAEKATVQGSPQRTVAVVPVAVIGVLFLVFFVLVVL